MIKVILLGFVILLILGIIYVALQPSDYRVSRGTKISAPASVVFDNINSFHRWKAWSPWAKMDPEMTEEYLGPESGKDAAYHWKGNSQVGEGKMRITESKVGERILIDLEFIKPFASSCVTEFQFQPEGSTVQVTWVMTGKKNFLSKLFCLFANMDKMVGGDFERGLAKLKSLSEHP